MKKTSSDRKRQLLFDFNQLCISIWAKCDIHDTQIQLRRVNLLREKNTKQKVLRKLNQLHVCIIFCRRNITNPILFITNFIIVKVVDCKWW